jgi:SAM-dependent methyltransferase
MVKAEYTKFYDQRRHETYGFNAENLSVEDHSFFPTLKEFIGKYNLADKKCLEIGSSTGLFQDMVEDYTGTDIADSLIPYYHKPYHVATGSGYPFSDAHFDAIWTITVYEHIPNLQQALLEIKRLLKPGGVVLFAPAWQCRSWAAEGYAVRPYADFGFRGKLVKATISVRDSLVWRSMFLVPKRLLRHVFFCFGGRKSEIRYKKIRPNYKIFWCADSDACNHIDPHDAILWFETHGFSCLSHPLHTKALLVRTGALVFQKNIVEGSC